MGYRMSFDKFVECMEGMRDMFGKGLYNSKRMDLIFERCSWMNPDDFTKICDDFIGASTKATVDDFQMAANKLKRKDNGARQCSECGNYGWVLYQGTTVYARRCRCLGGPEALARTIRNHETHPDPALADMIERNALADHQKISMVLNT